MITEPLNITSPFDFAPFDPAFADAIRADDTTGCWEWTGSRQRFGYGLVRRSSRLWKAHRWAWTLANGPIPDGLFICHHCDNPPCLRPDHLFLGTQADNLADMSAKGRASGGAHQAKRTHCPQDHPYDGYNLVRRADGSRACRTCSNARRAVQGARPVACPLCERVVTRKNIRSHVAAMHGLTGDQITRALKGAAS